VFVTTVGAPTFDECLEHLRRQDCAFRLVVLDGVAPLSAALQRMVDSCETPFYVQVDEDMLLRPHAIRTLHAGIAESDSRIAMVVGNLYDVHLERGIHGPELEMDVLRDVALARLLVDAQVRVRERLVDRRERIAGVAQHLARRALVFLERGEAVGAEQKSAGVRQFHRRSSLVAHRHGCLCTRRL